MRTKWNDKEMILTLYIYLTHDPKDLHKNSLFLIEFCKRLNRCFNNSRTPSSIEMRISNYKSVDPNYKKTGLGNGGKSVKEYWDRYHSQLDYMEEMYTDFVNSTMNEMNQDLIVELDEVINSAKYISKDTNKVDAYVETILNVRNTEIQSTFRKNLLMEFNEKCAICGVNTRNLLVASHILPYSKCNKKTDMINHNNGLLLCPNHDALFDSALISFDTDGKIVIGELLPIELYRDLNINNNIKLDKKYMTDERKKYLQEHMKIFNKKNGSPNN